MIGGGIGMIFGLRLPFFGEGLVSGMWLALIGWFLNNASIQSYQRVVIQDVLEGVPVEHMMRSNPPTVGPDISVGELVHDHVMGTDDYGFPVLDAGRLVGLVTLEDVRAVQRDAWNTTTVREIMTPADQLVTVAPGEDSAQALYRLAQRDVRQLPVLSGDSLVGLLRRRDIVKWLQLHAEGGANLRA
ncbi:MAG: hypothetical protein DRI48_10655 [Chloroflexi bacterium]|nr:MAG: hypothetical protein DRI48_10655 [Chloroflexota bacterium]